MGLNNDLDSLDGLCDVFTEECSSDPLPKSATKLFIKQLIAFRMTHKLCGGQSLMRHELPITPSEGGNFYGGNNQSGIEDEGRCSGWSKGTVSTQRVIDLVDLFFWGGLLAGHPDHLVLWWIWSAKWTDVTFKVSHTERETVLGCNFIYRDNYVVTSMGNYMVNLIT